MNYLFGGGKVKVPVDLMADAFEEITKDDVVLLIGATSVDDRAAEQAFAQGVKIRKIAPDNPLRGNDARYYAFRQLAKDADVINIFFKHKDDEVKQLIEIGAESGKKVVEYQIH